MLQKKLEKWINNLMIPQDNLGGLPICPFAKKGMVNDEVQIIEFGYKAIWEICQEGKPIIKKWKNNENKKLLLFVIPLKFDYSHLNVTAKILMNYFPDLAILVGHPEKPTIINGITTTFPYAGILFIQHKDYLGSATESLKKTNYYSFWTKQQLDDILNWR